MPALLALMWAGSIVAQAMPTPTVAGTVATPHGDIYYERFGSGPAVMVLHGFAARWRVEQWADLLAALPGHTVIGIDVRGYGRSAKPHEESAYGVEVAEDVVRVLDSLQISSVTLVGYSMGGIIAMDAAVLHPDRIPRLVLIGQGWLSADELEQMAGAGRGLLAIDTSALAEADREGFRRNDVRALAAMTGAYGALFVPQDAVASYPGHILAVVGSEDPRRARADTLAALNPRVERVVLPDRTHGSIVRDAEYAHVIARWLGSVD